MNMDQKYDALFTPWKVGNVEIKNRIVMCPMGGTSLFGWFELTGCEIAYDGVIVKREAKRITVSLLFIRKDRC